MKNRKLWYYANFTLIATVVVCIISFANLPATGERFPMDHPVKIKIGKSGCSEGFGICEMQKVTRSSYYEQHSMEEEGIFYAMIHYEGGESTCQIKTARDKMSENTFQKYFSGDTFTVEDDYTISVATIANQKEITIKAGTPNIQKSGDNITVECRVTRD